MERYTQRRIRVRGKIHLMPDDETILGVPEGPTLPVTAGRAPEPRAQALPANIGRYRIIRLLGEGGMGAVYEAEQDQPRRSVALKVISAAWASPELLRRFEQESRAPRRLQHPGIAQI
jgi:serine/threonine protein kinase